MAKADGAISTGAMSRQAISRSERGRAAPARPSVAARHERGEEQEEAPAPAEAAAEDEEVEESRTGGNLDDADIGRTDDPVRMYLREMGSVELLSREGEIAIAKRIEAGRDMMIGGICESPLTY